MPQIGQSQQCFSWITSIMLKGMASYTSFHGLGGRTMIANQSSNQKLKIDKNINRHSPSNSEVRKTFNK